VILLPLVKNEPLAAGFPELAQLLISSTATITVNRVLIVLNLV
jgi:hypothetical protein